MTSALEKFKRLIQDEGIRPMKPWRNRRYGRGANERGRYKNNLKKNIRMILSLLSGGDIVHMLKCKTLLLSKIHQKDFYE